jgi:hypothetical protein
MKSTIKNLSIGTLLLLTCSANAAIISYDLNSENDNLVTLDDSTGIEWLDGSVTAGKTLSEVNGMLSTNLKGWRLPTRAEINSLFSKYAWSANLDSNNTAYKSFNKSLNAKVRLFNTLVGNGTTNPYSISTSRYYMIDSNNSRVQLTLNSSYFKDETSAIVGSNVGDNTVYDGFYHLLVSDGGYSLSSISDPSLNANNANAPINSVPVPASLGLLGLALAGLRFKKKKNKG